MVDVGAKKATHRVARARAVVELPPEVLRLFDQREIVSPKGPVFQTAVLAGTMAAKKTADLIPLCHPIPIENCHIDIEIHEGRVVIDCTVSVHHKTGVEMEALTGASVAALTVYDMCKGVSRNMRVVEVALIEKRGGRSDRGAAGKTP
jgi:cyclic pyranopterin phosphate synthase